MEPTVAKTTSSTSDVICPYCGYRNKEAWDWCKDYESEHECGDCEKTFVAWGEASVTYYAKPLDLQKSEVK
jgi:transposase